VRHAVVPLFSAGVVTLALFAASVLTTGTAPELSRALATAEQVALATVPLAFLLGLFSAHLARVSVGDLVVELGRMPQPRRRRRLGVRARDAPHPGAPGDARDGPGCREGRCRR